MSFILDALRKSQQARQPSSVPHTGAVHNITLDLTGSGWWVALGLLLLTAVLTMVLVYWWNTMVNRPAPEMEPAPVSPTVATPSPPAVPAATAPAPTLAEPPAKKTTGVSDLSEQVKVPLPAAPPKKLAAAKTQTRVSPPKAPAATQSDAGEAVPLVMDDTPLLQQMPQEFQRTMPSLAVTIHVYSHDEAQQILFINNREYRKGSLIEGRILVEDIVPDGAVLSYRGERFKLSRPR